MLPQERYNYILEMLKKNNIIKIDTIMSHFNVSVETARRDLSFLEKEGLIRKIYGGATLISKPPSEPVSIDRIGSNLSEKEAIGKKCSEFINDGDCILLEVGTTTLQVAKAIKNKKNLTVITNSIYIVNELIDTDINLYIIGGKVRHEEKAISGAVSMFDIENFNISKTIIGAGAITPENGISDYNIEESLMRKKIIKRSKNVYLVADTSKFGFDLLVSVCDVSDIDLIITGKGLDPKMAKALEEAGTKLVFAN